MTFRSGRGQHLRCRTFCNPAVQAGGASNLKSPSRHIAHAYASPLEGARDFSSTSLAASPNSGSPRAYAYADAAEDHGVCGQLRKRWLPLVMPRRRLPIARCHFTALLATPMPEDVIAWGRTAHRVPGNNDRRPRAEMPILCRCERKLTSRQARQQ
jgi:hypothetical protein